MNKVEVVNSQHLSVLLGKDMNLHIPSYQRGYCWEKKQVECLLESLWAANRDMEYHLGTIILHKYGEVCNIVDGQQRLLTLSILMHKLKIDVSNPLLKSETNDLDVIKHVFNNSEIISNWIACHPPVSPEGLLDKLVFTVVTISQNDSAPDTETDSDKDNASPQTDSSTKDEYDSSLPLAWTFFNAINSGGKLLSDYDLLKAHHLRYLSSAKSSDLLIQHKASKWDSNGEQKVESFYGEKLNLYEVSFAHTFYLIRSWLKNRSITISDLPADSRYCILHHYSALLSLSSTSGEMMGLTSGVIGGKQFFDWSDYWMWRFREFCDNPVVKCYNKIPWAWPQRHLRIIARALLFYYFSKFGDLYLADACIFILYRIGRLRNTSARKKNAWYGNDSKGDKCAPHTIAAIEESPSPEYFFQYCQMPSNRYVRHYNLKDNTKNKDNEWLKKFTLGPDWWKRLLVFAASPISEETQKESSQKGTEKDRIPICLDVPNIGGSICYKKEIAELLNDVANDFGWEYDPQTLELKYKNERR